MEVPLYHTAITERLFNKKSSKELVLCVQGVNESSSFLAEGQSKLASSIYHGMDFLELGFFVMLRLNFTTFHRRKA